MKDVFASFTDALKLIVKDPACLFLALMPTLIALTLYLSTIYYIWDNTDNYLKILQGYVNTSSQADFLSKILAAVLILFIFLFMSWTFVFVAGILATPFNTLLSARLEKLYLAAHPLDFKLSPQNFMGWKGTIKNELKKVILIVIVGLVAFMLNLFPLLYPIGLTLFSLLLAVQFLDYSWSRHNLTFSGCLKDIMLNLIGYLLGGFFFLFLVTVPILNAFIPAMATGYFTILWIKRQKPSLPR